MKTITIVLLLAGAGYLGYRYLYKGGADRSSKASPRFIPSCRKASAEVAQVEAYCACLAKNGVKDMMSLATDPASRAAVSICQTQVGHVAAPRALRPASGAGRPAPTGRGRPADNMVNQLQKAYDRRKMP